jgi:ribosome maturation factor RimP
VRKEKQELVDEVERRLTTAFPDVELVDLDLRGGRSAVVTLYVDRPGGVDLELCEAVTKALDELRARYALEVSSPGLDRRLRTAAHFAAVVGQKVAVTLDEPRDGRRNYRGGLAAAGAGSVTLTLDGGGEATLPLTEIATAHVVYDFEANGGRRE